MAPPVTAAASILFVFAWAAAQAPPNVTAQPEERQDLEFHSPHVPKPTDDFSQYLFGDWVGVRPRLAAWGVTVAALVIADPFGNLSGGIRRGAADYNLAAFGVILHTDRLLGWPGGQFHVGFAENFGTSLSRDYVGNDASPSQIPLQRSRRLFLDLRPGRVRNGRQLPMQVIHLSLPSVILS